MNSSQTYQAVLSKLQLVMTSRWTTAVANHNANLPTGSNLTLPDGPRWNVVTGYPADDPAKDTNPSVVVVPTTSTFSNPLTYTRQETMILRTFIYLPDSARGLATSVPLAQVAARIAGDLLETHLPDSPGDDTNGVSYRFDWQGMEPSLLPGGTGGAAVLTGRLEIRATIDYRPTLMPTTQLPQGFRQNLVYGIPFRVLDGATEILAETANFGESFSAGSSTITTIEVDPLASAVWDAGIAYSDAYALAAQAYPLTFAAGVASVDVTAAFAALTTGQSIEVRLNLIDTTRKVSTFFSIQLTKT